MYRCDAKLEIERKVDFQIKRHFHYYRQYKD